MNEFIVRFSEVFLPLFVAMSPLTVLPIFLAMTEAMNSKDKSLLARHAIITGLLIAVAIIFLGQAMFRFLHITVDDLRVAGGVILLLIAVYDLIFTREQRKQSDLDPDAGVVPLGTPIIVGPATLATCIVLSDSHGKALVIVSMAINMALIWALLHFAEFVTRFIRPSIARAFGKVMSLFLAAIAVAMFRVGVAAFIN
ncbi:MAG: MarC family protein [Myxococcales bacterium]|nr:MAG: MarC family protein [Myxococcales bacterium]